MTDTAQPATAADPVVAQYEDPHAAGAEAFKVALGQAEAPEPRRDERGRFASDAPEQIEAEAEAQAPEAAESQEEGDGDEEAADEAQQSESPLPTSWPEEQAETWRALPPETQAFIAEREGQRDAAVNAKFQEAANVRKAHEGEIMEARAVRQHALQGLDLALSAIKPWDPPHSMLDINSNDYDPDAYHLAKAQHAETVDYLNNLGLQRQNLVAQGQQEAKRQDEQRFLQIQQATAPAFVKLVPDVTDQAKAPAIFQGLIDYAIQSGAPADIFNEPTSALEWTMIWKSREYDKLQSAKAKVQTDLRPEPRRAAPPVRPGVATPPSARAAARRQGASDRLARSGSIEDGAAVWKQFLK